MVNAGFKFIKIDLIFVLQANEWNSITDNKQSSHSLIAY